MNQLNEEKQETEKHIDLKIGDKDKSFNIITESKNEYEQKMIEMMKKQTIYLAQIKTMISVFFYMFMIGIIIMSIILILSIR